MVLLYLYLATAAAIAAFVWWAERRWPDRRLIRPLTKLDLFLLCVVAGLFWVFLVWDMPEDIRRRSQP